MGSIFVTIIKLPFLFVDAVLLAYSPARLLRRAMGFKDKDEKGVLASAIEYFFDVTSWLAAIILAAILFHTCYRWLAPS